MDRRGIAAVRLSLCWAVVLAAQPGDPAAMAAEARRAMAEKRFGEATEIYTQLLPLAPEDIGMLVNLGMARSLAGRHEQAIEPLSKVVAKEPGIFPAQLFLGSSYLSLGKLESALGPLEAAAKIDARHVPVRRMLGDAYSSLERPARALPHRKKLTELEAENPANWAALGQTYEQLARQAFSWLQETAPESAYMVRLLGDVRFSAQQYPSAFYLYREALKRQPGWRGLHAAIAEIYRRTGRAEWAAAEEAKERALGEINCEAERFECLFAQRKFEELRHAAAGLTTSQGYYWRTQANGRLAEKSFQRLENMPPSLAFHVTRAEVYKGRERFKDAADEWAQALKLQPRDANIEAELTIALYQSRQFEKAEPRLRALLEKRPNEADWPFMLGDILLSRQEVEDATPLLEKAAQLDPKLLAARHALGRAYMQLGRDADAIPHLKQALPLDNDGSLSYQLAQAYRSTGNREAAVPLLEQYQKIQAAQRQAAEEFQTGVQITAPE